VTETGHRLDWSVAFQEGLNPGGTRGARPSEGCWWRVVVLAVLLHAGALPAVDLRVDFSRSNGLIRPLHGGNNGPLNYGELVNLSDFHRELAIPFTRLHDSDWPYADIVDIHAIFPDFKADAGKPESYRFEPTDDYLRAITNTGARIVYRLGESIEHAPRKRYVHPPADPEKWAAICAGIIRHYNEGWAGGHHFGIGYWEIWNEPENRPAMWTGTAEEYFRLYSITARAIKQRWPTLKVGGPALGYQGEYKTGALQPSPFLRGFLDRLRHDNAPLDFFSWHLYSDDPSEPSRRARAVRKLLDTEGFTSTESHLNEWNYLPGNDWKPMTRGPGAVRERWYERQGGPEGAAYIVCALLELQSAPVDIANFYSMENQPFGLFTLHGAPKRNFFAFKAFRELLETPVRVEARGGLSGQTSIGAGLRRDQREAAVLAGNYRSKETKFDFAVSGLPWNGATECEIFLVDETHTFERMRREQFPSGAFALELDLNAPSIAMIKLRPVR
jgi:xylan 1,4-beta-xylosidase